VGRLTLTLKTGEAILLTGPDGRLVEVFVARADSGRVSLAVTALDDVKIQRRPAPQTEPGKG